MAKSTPNESLDTVARLLDLVPFLTTHQGIAIGDLAKAFSISVEQVTKDLTTLWMCGLPGYTAYELIDLSFDSGFVTISNAETLERPRALNRDEVLALLLGLEFLKEDLKDSQSGALDLVSDSIGRLTALIGTVVSRSVQAGDSSDSALLALCNNAISHRTAIEIEYHSVSRDEITRRVVHPYDLSSDAQCTYVFAYCESSGGNRTFRVDRIVSAREIAGSQEVPFQSNDSATQPVINAKVSVASRKRDISERLKPDQPFDAMSDTIDFRGFSSEWAVREVMSFGGAAQVLEPVSLRQHLLERATKALSAYK